VLERLEVSIELIFACAYGLRRMARAASRAAMSSRYVPLPRMNRVFLALQATEADRPLLVGLGRFSTVVAMFDHASCLVGDGCVAS